ncbi:MAG: hypothetical protein ACYDCO_11995 [Armatimonadota bacterium]
MIEEWGHIIPVDPTYVPSPAAQFQALQFWAARDKQGSSKTIEIHAQVQYIPPTDGTLHAVCCPNCRRTVEPGWLEDAVNLARVNGFTNLLTEIPCCGAFVSLNDLKVTRGFAPFGFARFCMSTHNPDPLSVGNITLKHLETILGCQLRVVWKRRMISVSAITGVPRVTND